MKTRIPSSALAAVFCLGLAPQVQAACDWPVLTDPDLVNVFYPDTNADYWISVIPAVPGTRLRIEGQYNNARYFSFNVYDPLGRPMDALADVQLDPDEGHHNPFIKGDDQWGGRYTAYIEVGNAEGESERNTMYTGEFQPRKELPSTTAANPTFSIMYRVYIPGTPGQPEGDVPLPKITLEVPAGEGVDVPLERCGPFTDSPLPNSPVNEAEKNTDYPKDTIAIENTVLIKDEPEFQRFYGLPSALAYFGDNATNGGMPDQLRQPDGGGLYSNVDNAYVFGAFERGHGDVYVVRGKAPTYRGDSRVETLLEEKEQVRYWSLCTTEFITQRYVECLADYNMVLDEDGYFTLVVSETGERPDWAHPKYGVNWLPWGVHTNSNLVYRHMMPNLQFAEAIQNVPQGTAIGDVMLEYAPQAAYCNEEAVQNIQLTELDAPADADNDSGEGTNGNGSNGNGSNGNGSNGNGSNGKGSNGKGNSGKAPDGQNNSGERPHQQSENGEDGEDSETGMTPADVLAVCRTS